MKMYELKELVYLKLGVRYENMTCKNRAYINYQWTKIITNIDKDATKSVTQNYNRTRYLGQIVHQTIEIRYVIWLMCTPRLHLRITSQNAYNTYEQNYGSRSINIIYSYMVS